MHPAALLEQPRREFPGAGGPDSHPDKSNERGRIIADRTAFSEALCRAFAASSLGYHPALMSAIHSPSRRRFLGTVPAGAGALLLARKTFPQTEAELAGKTGLRMLSERPINAETWVTDLDPRRTPNDRHFVRNNGGVPERALAGDLGGWSLRVMGEVEQELELTLDDLMSGFPNLTRSLVLECAGNGRAGFRPFPGRWSWNAPETAGPDSVREPRAISGGWARWGAPAIPGCGWPRF